MDPIEIDEHQRLLYYKRGYTAGFVREVISSERLTGLHVFAHLAPDIPADLEFLRDFSFLKRLVLTVIPPEDYEYGFLSQLPELEDFSLNVTLLPRVKANPIELGQVPQLKSLTLTWRDEVRGLAELTQLETLKLIEFRGHDDLRAIPAGRKLKHLMLKTASLRSVAGIERLPELETLELGACARLRDLSDLAALSKLRELTLAACPKLTELASLASLTNLSQLTLEDCPRLASIRPLLGLKLDRLRMCGSTDIRDGDTTPASGVRELSYYHRKHYNQLLPTPLGDAVDEENRRKLGLR